MNPINRKDERTAGTWIARVGRLFAGFFNHRKQKGNGYLSSFTNPDTESCEADLPVHVRHKPERLDVLCKNTKFTYKELQIIYRGFKNDCPTGMVNEDTFKHIYTQFFPHGDCSVYAHYVFKTFDQDNRGVISFEDFVIGMSMLVRGSIDEKLRWAFNLYDINGDGLISRSELLDIVNAVYSMMGKYTNPYVDQFTARDHADWIFNKLDVNQDGVITFDEFMDICTRDENIHQSMSVFDTIL